MTQWAIQLFNKSIVKQVKFHHIRVILGDVAGKACLDIGSDNGVISYLLRERGGQWWSADSAETAVASIRSLVTDRVVLIKEGNIPFPNESFDVIVIVDMLEHVQDDSGFLREINRILKKNGLLIINVPHAKSWSLVVPVKNAMGLTDAAHGHVRAGYTVACLTDMLGSRYTVEETRTYSKFFLEMIDAVISWAVAVVNKKSATSKGVLVTQEDMNKYRRLFRIYTLIYPCMWLVEKCDHLLIGIAGHRLIVRARKK